MDNPLWGCFFNRNNQKDGLLEWIRDLPMFDGLSNNELHTVERMIHIRKYSAGEEIFREEVPGANLYIVKSGEVVIRKSIDVGGSMDLAIIKEHHFFGEMALIDEIPRSAAAVALTDSVLLTFSEPDLEKIRDRNPKLALKIVYNIARLLCKRLVKANENMESLQKSLLTHQERMQKDG